MSIIYIKTFNISIPLRNFYTQWYWKNIIYIYMCVCDSQREKKFLKIFRPDAFFSYLYFIVYIYIYIYIYTIKYLNEPLLPYEC